jgi:hypothetical protein
MFIPEELECNNNVVFLHYCLLDAQLYSCLQCDYRQVEKYHVESKLST